MRSTTHNNQLNHLTLMYVYQEKNGKIDICMAVNEFIARKGSRKEQFKKFLKVSEYQN